MRDVDLELAGGRLFNDALVGEVLRFERLSQCFQQRRVVIKFAQRIKVAANAILSA